MTPAKSLIITVMLVIFCLLAQICLVSADSNTVVNSGARIVNGVLEKPVVQVSSPEKSIAAANNKFSSALFSNLVRENISNPDNILYSPFSISSALAIAFEGARGKTADEIQSVFNFPKNNETLRNGYYNLTSGFNRKDKGYTLDIANALWAEKSYAFNPGYINLSQIYYNANTSNLDFMMNPGGSREVINTWTLNKTGGKIKNLIPPGGIQPDTRLVITNSVYFNGSWEKKFDPALTKDADFRISEKKTKKVSMMEKTDENAIYNYTETSRVQVIKLPYSKGNGTGLSMIILLPKGNTLNDALGYLDPGKSANIISSLDEEHVMVYLPKFKLETEYDLKENLVSMGMLSAFSNNANFSGMGGTKNLYIDKIIHKAYIDVNEEGTEAAAATAVIAVGGAAFPVSTKTPVFRADHPFIFLIVDDETGAILFAGRVTNPVP